MTDYWRSSFPANLLPPKILFLPSSFAKHFLLNKLENTALEEGLKRKFDKEDDP